MHNLHSDFISDFDPRHYARRPYKTDAGPSKEDMVMVIKVQYDARSHTFKLVDQEFRTILEGDALYDLALPLMFEGDFVEDLVSTAAASIAHA